MVWMLRPARGAVPSPTFLWDLGPGPRRDLPKQEFKDCCRERRQCEQILPTATLREKVECLEGRLARQSRGYVSGKMGTGEGVRGRRVNY